MAYTELLVDNTTMSPTLMEEQHTAPDQLEGEPEQGQENEDSGIDGVSDTFAFHISPVARQPVSIDDFHIDLLINSPIVMNSEIAKSVNNVKGPSLTFEAAIR